MLEQLRAAVQSALAEMERAHQRLNDRPGDSELIDAFDRAERIHRNAVRDLERAETLEEARASQPSPGRTRVEGEPRTYARRNGESYFLDLARVQVNGDPAARERLERHGREVADELRAREEAHDRALEHALEALTRDLPDPLAEAVRNRLELVERRDLTRTDGAGGHFVPPIWLLDEYAELARGGRPFANACRQVPLPEGTDQINVPRIATGTLTGVQTADNAAVTEQDLVDAVVTAPVRTIAGQQDLALQLLEQSPIAFDEVVFADLVADYNFRVEDQAFNGSGAAGQVLGIRNVVGVNPVSYTDASPTVPELYPKVADALSQARTARKRPINRGWIAPRRFYWLTAALDANNRPFVVPDYAGPQNAPGVYSPRDDEDVPVRIQGVRHEMTDAIPVNLGAGTNEDVIVQTRMQDHILFEGDLRARALMEVLSGTLSVRLQVYAYVAFTAGRFPAATSIISGTGLVAPTFA